MNPFNFEEIEQDNLRDAHYRRIARLHVPDSDSLEAAAQMRAECEERLPGFSLLSNVEVQTQDETTEIARTQIEATTILLSRILRELTGESEFLPQHNGYSLGKNVEILSQHCFVQISELTIANASYCLNEGGIVLAFFWNELWQGVYKETDEERFGIAGYKAVQLKGVEAGEVLFVDPTENGKTETMDQELFNWLAKGGWCLEVYK